MSRSTWPFYHGIPRCCAISFRTRRAKPPRAIGDELGAVLQSARGQELRATLINRSGLIPTTQCPKASRTGYAGVASVR